LEEYESKITSQYVLMEIRRGLIRNLVTAYNYAEKATEFSQVMGKVEALLPTPRQHLPRTTLQILRIFFQSIQHERLVDLAARYPDATLGDYHLCALISALRLSIRNRWRNACSLVDRVINEVNCYPELPGVRQVGNKFDATMPFCETLGVPCRIVEFVKQHREDFEKILGAVAESPRDAETEDRIKVLQTVLEDPNKARQHKVCWDLGDALICVEAPGSSDVVNNNPRHMDVICKALGKRSVHWR
jgi:hypothetical protein